MPAQFFTANGTFIVPTYTSLIVIVDGAGAGGPDSGGVPGANATGNNTFNTTLVAQPGQTNSSSLSIPGPAAGGDVNASGGAMNGGDPGVPAPPPGDGTGDGFTGGG